MTFHRVVILLLVLLAAPSVFPNGLLLKEFDDAVSVLFNGKLNDDQAIAVDLPKGIKVQNKDKLVKEFYVSSNGALMTREGITSFDARSAVLNFRTLPAPAFLPYFTDINMSGCRNNCNLKVVVDVKEKTLSVLRRRFGINADPESVLVASWSNVPHLKEPNKEVSFQVVIAGEASGAAYAIFSYENLEYGNRKLLQGSNIVEVQTLIGAKLPSFNIVYHQKIDQNAQDLQCSSNAFSPGLFILGLNNLTIPRYWIKPQSVDSNINEVFIRSSCSNCRGDISLPNNGVCTELFAPVCASDNKTYGNPCLFHQQQCRVGGDLQIVKDEPCEVATTKAPTTKQPTTQPPTTKQPTTQPPTTKQPTTQPPTTKQPTTQPPTTKQPTTQPPTTNNTPPNPPQPHPPQH
uniref:Kazal-like domain-containing protein n=1 Tax=Clytia hemisphaerica TaxID=252671 RepID=A0A7M5VC43_9CNID